LNHPIPCFSCSFPLNPPFTALNSPIYIHPLQTTPIANTFSIAISSPLFDKPMSGVWVFKNGVVRLVENPGVDSFDGSRQGSNTRRKLLIDTPSNEAIASYAVLEHKLSILGWERYYDDPDLLQFHKRSTIHLISLPKDFSKFKSMHMFDIVVKNRNMFEVRDV
ncbi:hypothetical protein ES288_A01G031300v1, partial [Gossypium darwinii]